MTRFTYVLTLLLSTGLAGCSCAQSHELLSTRDGAADSMPLDGDAEGPDASPDAGECGPPPPITLDICAPFISDVEGAYCCQDERNSLECRDGRWQCPLGQFERSECATFSSAGVDGCSFCDPMPARTHREREAACFGLPESRYGWDGRACRETMIGCGYSECVGSSCDSLFAALEDCVSAHAVCGAGACEAMDVRFEPSDPIPCNDSGAVRWQWNGWACERFVGCRSDYLACDGADCAEMYDDRATCEAERGLCGRGCDATDALLVHCEPGGATTRYFVWNGHDCTAQTTCEGSFECEGSECERVFPTFDACIDEHRHCVGPVEPTRGLTCNLSPGEVVTAALRLGACDVASANDVIGGYFELGLALPVGSPSPGYVPDCSVVTCASTASSCAALGACLEARRGAACEVGSLDQCVGDEVHRCDPGGRLVLEGDCAAVRGTCETVLLDDGRTRARCETPGNPAPGAGFVISWCDHDELVMNIGGEAVRISCDTHIPGSECREVRYAGEFPAFVCAYPTPSCSEYLTSALSCDGDDALLCVGGQDQRVDCVAAGYARCEEGLGCRG